MSDGAYIALGLICSTLIYCIAWMRIARDSGEDCSQDMVGFTVEREDEEGEEDE